MAVSHICMVDWILIYGTYFKYEELIADLSPGLFLMEDKVILTVRVRHCFKDIILS